MKQLDKLLKLFNLLVLAMLLVACGATPAQTPLAAVSSVRSLKLDFAYEFNNPEGHKAPLNQAILFDNGERVVSKGLDNTIIVWDTKNGKQIQKITEGIEDYIYSVAINVAEDKLVANTLKGITLWDLKTGKLEKRFSLPKQDAGTVGFTFDAKYIIFTTMYTKAPVYLIDINKSEVTTAFTPDTLVSTFTRSNQKNLVAFGLANQKIVIWDYAQNKIVKTWLVNSSRGFFQNIVFDNTDSKLFAYFRTDDGKNILSVWDVTSDKMLNSFVLSLPSKDVTSSVIANTDGDTILFLGTNLGKIIAFDTATGKKLNDWSVSTGKISVLATQAVGNLLVSVSGSSLSLWDIKTGKSIQSFEVISGNLSTVAAFSPDNKVLALGNNIGEVGLWDVKLGKELLKFQAHPQPIAALAFSPDGTLVATASQDKDRIISDNLIKLWETATGKEVATFVGHTEPVTSLKFSRDNAYLVSGGFDHSVRVWDVKQKKAVGVPLMHTHNIFSLTIGFNSSKPLLASGDSDGVIKIWDLSNFREVASWEAGVANARNLIFSKDDSYLISQGNTVVEVWNVSNKTLVNQVKTENNNVTACLGITADKNYLIMMDEKQPRIFLWKIAEGKEVFSEPLPNTAIAYAHLSEDGTTLLVTTQNNISKLFNLLKIGAK